MGANSIAQVLQRQPLPYRMQRPVERCGEAVVQGLMQDENDNAGAVAVVEAVKAAARQSRVPWLIDAHSGKGEDQGDDADPLRAMRGASTAAGSADYVLSLRYANGTFGSRRRLSGKGRFVSLEPVTLEFDADSTSYSLIGDVGAVTRESTWRMIDETGALDADEPRSLTDIGRRCGLMKPTEKPSGAKRQQILGALKDRPDVGRVDGLRGGQKTTLYRRLVLP